MNSGKLNTKITLIAGIIIVINLLADQFFFRIDFTEEKQYTLSKATKNVLTELNEPVTVKAYFSEQLPPDIAKTKKDFKELLIEYSSISKEMLVYDFINPNEDEKNEQDALQDGVQPVMINVREKDQMKQQKAYLGAVVSFGEKKEVIPFMQPGGPMEYALTSAIKKLVIAEKPTIALLQGHGEPSLSEMQQVNAALSVLYNFETLELNDSAEIASHIKTIAIVRPKDSIPFAELKKLDNFMSRGGKIMLAINRVNGDFQTTYGTAVNTGIEKWLSSKGLLLEDNFVIDSRCGAVTVQQQQGIFTFQSQVQFPYIPILNKFADHPVTKGLEAVVLQFASSINYAGDTSKKYTPLAFTSEQSGSVKAPQYFDIQKQWSQADFPAKNLVVAAALENPADNSKLVLIGDGDFPVNGERGRAQQLQPDNVNLMVNAIDWLSDDTGLIDLRTRGVASRPLDQIEDTTKTLLKYFNFLLPVILVVLYGFVRMQMKRAERVRRMEEDYNL